MLSATATNKALASVAVDKREAVKWYKRAADAGHTIVKVNLGNIYKTGECATVNKSETFK